MLVLDSMDNSSSSHHSSSSPRKRLSGGGGGSNGGTKGKQHLPAARVSSTRLRSNLLTKLGISPSSYYSAASKQSQQPTAISLLANAKMQRIPLKTCCDEMDRTKAATPLQLLRGSPSPSSAACQTDAVFQAWGSLWTNPKPHQAQAQQQQSGSLSSQTTTTSSSSSTTMMSTDNNRNHDRHVRFDNDVQVTLIPTRHEYSNRIRKFLWDPPEVMQRNIIINTLEFTADGWNEQSALEEEEHYYNPTTQQYIHPVHLEIAQMPPEERDDICPPNYINPALVQPQQQSTPTA